MKAESNIVSGIISIKQAYDHFEVFGLEHPNSRGQKLFEIYSKKLRWIYEDLITNPLLPQDVRDGIKNEWEADTFIVDAISEKTALLKPEQREIIETIIDAMLRGEEVAFTN
jgi:hypothetical protein